MDWSIQQLARLAGTTSRTLRHYDSIGLLNPTRIASNGYRHYDEDALVRLQRILLLRQLGLGLPAIAEVLEHGADQNEALRAHLDLLELEQARLARQIAAVRSTIHAREKGTTIMAEEALDGFDHTQYRDEVEQRWGAQAYTRSNDWWQGLGEAGQQDFKQRVRALNAAWISLVESSEEPASEAAQQQAQRHVDWLRETPGTPMATREQTAAYLLGLGEMYVADPRFATNYGGEAGAAFVRDALRVYVERNLA